MYRKKIISFSLFGKKAQFGIGAEHNVREAKKVYPDWTCRFYCTPDTPSLKRLTEMDCEVILLKSEYPPIFWRMFACDDPEVDVCIVRDTDSVVNFREKAAVDEWLASDKTFHMMHDCKGSHWHKVMAGMWGIKKNDKVNFTQELETFCSNKGYKAYNGESVDQWGSGVARYFDDQIFLSDIVFPRFRDGDYMEHGEELPFPDHERLEFGNFVGDRVTVMETPLDLEDAKEIYMSTHLGAGDQNFLGKMIEYFCEKYEKVHLPVRPDNIEEISKISSNNKFIIRKHDEITDPLEIYLNEYDLDRVGFLGLGNYGKNFDLSLGMKLACYKQAGLEHLLLDEKIDLFDKVLCINLDEREDRWEHINSLPEAKILNIERFPAVPYDEERSKIKIHPTYSKWCHNGGKTLTMSDAERSILQTNYNIWEKYQDSKYIFRLEDDISFPDYFLDHLKESFKHWPADADIVFLNTTGGENYNDYFSKFNGEFIVGAWAYIITGEACKKLVSHAKKNGLAGPLDCFLPDVKDEVLNIYSYKKSMVNHLDPTFRSNVKHCGGHNPYYTELDTSKKKLKIAFHANELCLRGTGVALYDYAKYNEEILDNESIILHQGNLHTNDQEVVEKFKRRFDVFSYNDFGEVDEILEKEKVMATYMIKAGHVDDKATKVGKTWIHCVFKHNDPHGDKYAYVSEWLSEAASGGEHPFVPHIIDLPSANENLRQDLGIPDNAFVFGRHGDLSMFSACNVREIIRKIVSERKDIYFLFMNVNGDKIFEEEYKNIIYLDPTSDLQAKSNFINSCDAMIHNGIWGETFGCSIAEFLFFDKPVISWKGGDGQAHVDMLGDHALWYNNEEELYDRLIKFDKNKYLNTGIFKKLVEAYSPREVMQKFKEVFIND